MLALVVVIAAGATAALFIFAQLAHATIWAKVVPGKLGEFVIVGVSWMTLKYRLGPFEPVPESIDVASQTLVVRSNGMRVNPDIDVPLDATTAEIVVPRNQDIEVVRVWTDGDGNSSESEAIRFYSRDTIAPPTPGPLGEPELIGEDD